MQIPGEPSNPLQEGALFHGRYRVARVLGRGAMGIVYEVLDERTNGRRALKTMLPSLAWNDDARARFQREAQVIGGIESDHVVRVSDAGSEGDVLFVVMELLRGETLQSLIDRQRRLPASEVLTLLIQVARALERTSAAGIVHRDIKPENLFVTTREDGSPCVKVLDFGLAKLTVGPRAAQTRAIGTPLYMSPEQVEGVGTIGSSTDLYALAHVAYAALVGEAYWKPDTEDGAVAVFMVKVSIGAQERPSARAQRRAGVTLPPDFDDWFAKATAVDPLARFGGAVEQVEALARLLQSPALPAPSGGALPSAPRPAAGKRAVRVFLPAGGIL